MEGRLARWGLRIVLWDMMRTRSAGSRRIALCMGMFGICIMMKGITGERRNVARAV